jgi:hypothetical protein
MATLAFLGVRRGELYQPTLALASCYSVRKRRPVARFDSENQLFEKIARACAGTPQRLLRTRKALATMLARIETALAEIRKV